MASRKNDPTDAICKKARNYPNVVEGTSCTQASFKIGKTAFLYIGTQGGRFKAMFKLAESRPEAAELAAAEPDNFQVGSTSWVTARFSEDEPMPKKLWEKWLAESHGLSLPKKKGARKAGPKAK